MLSPIVLFVYNRLSHTRKTIEALVKNQLAKESDLIIYSDAAKNEIVAPEVEKVRAFLKTIKGFKSVKVVEREKNLGLAESVINGVSDVINKYGKVIVLEDDLVTTPFFLKFMNDALIYYEDKTNVISVHGYIYPIKFDTQNTFFIKGADCWGWATWKRGWDLFNANGTELLEKLEKNNKIFEFDFNGTYPYSQMLKDQVAGKNNSWAIRWYASAFLENKLTLYPSKSLVKNIGIDGSGTHSGNLIMHNSDLSLSPIDIDEIELIENKEAKKNIEIYFNSLKPSKIRSLLSSLKQKFL